jgi:hypothetical protein
MSAQVRTLTININRKGFVTQNGSSTYEVNIGDHVKFNLTDRVTSARLTFTNDPFKSGGGPDHFTLPSEKTTRMTGTFTMTLSNIQHDAPADEADVGGPLNILTGNIKVDPKPVE